MISGGRLEWGVGAGWYDHEYQAYGYEFPRRRCASACCARPSRSSPRCGASPTRTYEGRYYRRGAQCDPKPVQQPRPPVWIGGGGEQLTLRVVARLADKANFGGKPHEWAHKRDVLHAHCADVGRDPAEIELTWSPEVCVRESEAELRAESTRLGKASAPWRRAVRLLGRPATSWARPSRSCETHPRRTVDLGCTYFVPWCSDYPDDTHAAPVRRTVMPEFR